MQWWAVLLLLPMDVSKSLSQKKGGLMFFILTLKVPRKPASENVVCLCCLLNILANFSNLFLHTGKQCGPRSEQKTKQMTIVVIGALRAKNIQWKLNILL